MLWTYQLVLHTPEERPCLEKSSGVNGGGDFVLASDLSTCECMGKLIPLMNMDTKRTQMKKWAPSCALTLALGR